MHMKVIRLSALCTGRPYPQGDTPGTHFYLLLQVSSTQERNKSMKNPSCPIGSWSAVPQATAPQRAPGYQFICHYRALNSTRTACCGAMWDFQKIQWLFTYRIDQLVFVMKTVVFSQKIQYVYLLFRWNSCFGFLRKHANRTVGLMSEQGSVAELL
jgi:hypothetical protein